MGAAGGDRVHRGQCGGLCVPTAGPDLLPAAHSAAAHNGAANGTLVASATRGWGASGDGVGRIFSSTDDGRTWTRTATIADPASAGGALCCTTLYELPAAVGAYPAGTLLWATSTGSSRGTAELRLWTSTNQGGTWSFAGSIVSAPSTAASNRAFWEPEFAVTKNAELAVYYSDDLTAQAQHDQKLAEARTSDLHDWSEKRDVVASATRANRPGMAVVRKIGDGSYVMTYEFCGSWQGNCEVRMRTSADGWDWGDPATVGSVLGADGEYAGHAPTVEWLNSGIPGGTLVVVGQFMYNSNGTVAADSGQVMLVNEYGSWRRAPAPVRVSNAADACDNYSSPLLASADGQRVEQLAEAGCTAYFGVANTTVATSVRASLSGDGKADIAGIDTAGAIRAWINVKGFDTMPWGASLAVASMSTDPRRTRFADLDGDGKKDIISIEPDPTNPNASRVYAWHNGRGFASPPWDGAKTLIAEMDADPARTQFADLDGDGKADIIAIGADGNVTGWRNIRGFAENPWGGSQTHLAALDPDPTRIKFADLDGDGKADLISVGPDGKVLAWHNVLGFAPNPWAGGPTQIAAMDPNPDRTQFRRSRRRRQSRHRRDRRGRDRHRMAQCPGFRAESVGRQQADRPDGPGPDPDLSYLVPRQATLGR